MANLYLIDPSGKPVVLPAEGANLQDLANRGFTGRTQTKEEIATEEADKHPLLSFAEGAMREASFGFAEPIINRLNQGAQLTRMFNRDDGVDPEEMAMRLRARDETGAATAGKVLGFGAAMLAPEVGVAGALTKGAAKVTAKAGLAGAKAVAAKGALEGVGMGVGQLVSESTLDIPITTEHVVTSLVGNGVAGGVLGVAAHGVAGLVEKGARKVGTTDLNKAATTAANWTEKQMFDVPLTDAHIEFMRQHGITSGKASVSDTAMEAHAIAVREATKKGAGAVMPVLDNIAPPSEDVTKELLRRMASEARRVEDPSLIGKVEAMAAQTDNAARFPGVQEALGGLDAAHSANLYKAKAAYDEAVTKATVEHAANLHGTQVQNDAIETAALEAHDKLVAKITEGNAAAEAKAKAAYEKVLTKAKADHEKVLAKWKKNPDHVFETAPEFKPPDPIAAVKKEIPEFVAPKTKPLPILEDFKPFEPPTMSAKHRALIDEAASLEGASAPTWSELARMEREITGAGGKSHFEDILAAARKVAPEGAVAEQLAVSAEQYKLASEVTDAISTTVANSMKKNGANAGFLAGALLSAHPGLGFAELIGKQYLSPRWGFMVSDALRGGARGSLLDRAAKGIAQRMEGLSQVMGGDSFRVLLNRAAAKGNEALVAEHARIMHTTDAPEYMRAMGLQPEAPGEGDEQAGVVNSIASFSDSKGRMNDVHIDSFFNGGAANKAPRGSFKDFQTKMQNVHSILSNPTALYESLPSKMMGGTPAISGQAVSTAVTALQMLADAAPKDPGAGLPPALKRPWEPSPAELARWYRMLDAIQNPAKVVAQAGTGVVPRDSIKVLQTVYPAMYSDLQRKMMERMNKGQLTAAQRTGFQQLFGGPAMNPQQMQVVQGFHAKQGNPQQGPQPDGRQKVDAQENMETQGQRLEKR